MSVLLIGTKKIIITRTVRPKLIVLRNWFLFIGTVSSLAHRSLPTHPSCLFIVALTWRRKSLLYWGGRRRTLSKRVSRSIRFNWMNLYVSLIFFFPFILHFGCSVSPTDLGSIFLRTSDMNVLLRPAVTWQCRAKKLFSNFTGMYFLFYFVLSHIYLTLNGIGRNWRNGCISCSITSANEEGILEKATAALLSVRKVILAKMAPELTPETYVRHHRAFSPGLQEYIEARTFLSYCQDGSLINLAGMEAEFDGAFTIEPSDYVLGIADLTGELMRRAIAHGGIESVTIHSLLCEVQGCMVGLHRAFKVHKYMESKVKVMNQSVSKVQKRCFDNAIRRAEFQSDPHLKAVNADEPCPKKQKTSTV